MSPMLCEALQEDRAFQDETSLLLVPKDARARGRLIARGVGVLAGCSFAEQAFLALDPAVSLDWHVQDGDSLQPEDLVLSLLGSARGMLAAERTALNFLQQLSGVATQTARFVALASPVRVLDTRKTIPGLRDAQKAAVLAGGGVNHRRNLEDQILIKENHLALSGLSIEDAVRRAVQDSGGRVVGVEAQTETEAETALELGASFVLLDNFSIEDLGPMAERLRARFPEAVLEASGGIDAQNIAALARLSLDRVSVGALTHSSPALDLSLLLELA